VSHAKACAPSADHVSGATLLLGSTLCALIIRRDAPQGGAAMRLHDGDDGLTEP